MLTIIHTNDMHGRLLPAAAERLRTLRGEHPGALMLDAGDAISAGNLGVRLGGEPILELMGEIGYQAMTLGNRETHPRKELFPRKVDKAPFPLLCANIVPKNEAPNPTVPSVILEAGGVRVALFGVTVPMFTRKQWSQCLCDYWFDPPIDKACEMAEALRAQADVVVALTHIGVRQDEALAERGPAVDLIIGGHSHTDLQAPLLVKGLPILQARSHAFFAGVATLRVDDGPVTLAGWEKVALRPTPPRETGAGEASR